MTSLDVLDAPAALDAEQAVHHHAIPVVPPDDYAIAVGLGLALTAVCGVTRPADPNALRLPCCPRCAAHLTAPCSGGRS